MTRTRSTLARIALVTTLATGLTAVAPNPADASSTGPRARMYRATNRSRVNHEIKRVNIHDRISRLARRHSIAMANEGKIFHTSNPAGKYLKGTDWTTWGENVGVTGGSIAELQQAFMDSPLHRANVLNKQFRRVAVGTYRDDDGVLWVTIFFYG